MPNPAPAGRRDDDKLRRPPRLRTSLRTLVAEAIEQTQRDLGFPEYPDAAPVEYEMCSHCDDEVTIRAEYISAQGQFFCPNCGTPQLLCSACDHSAADACCGCTTRKPKFKPLPKTPVTASRKRKKT